MDVALYVNAIRRHKELTIGGVVLAVVLAVLTIQSQHSSQRYKGDATLFITQKGFPWGRTVTPYLPGNTQTGEPSQPTIDPQRLASLTGLYAQLATSDPVKSLMAANTHSGEAVTVTAVPAPQYANPAILPLLDLSATAPSRKRAVDLANTAAVAFQRWLTGQQQQASIPDSQRVVVQLIGRASTASLISGRGRTLPAIVFLTVLVATFGLLLVLENMQSPPAVSAAAGGRKPGGAQRTKLPAVPTSPAHGTAAEAKPPAKLRPARRSA
jgi:hypothetical protein